MNKFSIENKTVIITGGTGHLGTAISKEFIKCYANTYVLSRNSASQKELKTFTEDNGLMKYLNLRLIDIFEHEKVGKLVD